MNLILAIFWLAGAAALFLYEYQTGRRILRILGTDLSFAWLLLVLGLYNVARWVSLRSGRAARRVLQDAQAQRHRATHHPERREQPPDPNFNFTDLPPLRLPAPNGRRPRTTEPPKNARAV